MKRPRCFICERFARFLIIAHHEHEHVCKRDGVSTVKRGRAVGESLRLVEAFDEAWQSVNWRDVEVK